MTLEANSEAYSEPCQTSKMEVFTKIGNDFSFLTIFVKSSILDIHQDSEFPSEPSKDLQKNLHLRCLAGWCWIHLCINYFCKIFAYWFIKWVLLYCAPSSTQLHPALSTSTQVISTSTQLHPPPHSSFQPPPSSLQHPQQYLNQNIARNWAISPNLG